MDVVGLKELRALPHGLRVLNDDPNCSGSGSVRYLDPVSRNGSLGREVDGDGRDGVTRWVTVQLSDKKIVILHTQGELLHIDVVDGTWGHLRKKQRRIKNPI